jgi:hypothetical protein
MLLKSKEDNSYKNLRIEMKKDVRALFGLVYRLAEREQKAFR